MKYIVKAAPVAMDPEPFGTEHLIGWLVATDRRFNESGPGIRAGLRIEDAIKACSGCPYIGPIQPEHYSLLSAAAEEPTAGYPKFVVKTETGEQREIMAGRAVLPSIDAIKDAADEAPEKPAEEKPAA